jgi:copper chaperone NosL
LVVVAAFVAACGGSGPKPIALGEASCALCRMTIDDARRGGEVITPKGKILTFDSIECLASFYHHRPDTSDAASVWVSNFEQPGTFVSARDARFVRERTRHGSMGLGLVAFATAADTAMLRREYGELLTWNQVVELVERSVALR